MDEQAQFVYGLTETNREAIKSATRIANPGCFATATLLGLAPLVANNLLSCRVIVDAKTGSSGSGAKAAGEYASSTAVDFLLRVQAFHASARTGDRTRIEINRRVEQ
jgi:N-acetyl-gamma-glutamylphosphate reductase